MDTAVFVCLPCSFSPIEILEPLYLRTLETIELAHQRYRPPEIQSSILVEEKREVVIDNLAFLDRREDHAHKQLSLVREIVRKSCQENT